MALLGSYSHSKCDSGWDEEKQLIVYFTTSIARMGEVCTGMQMNCIELRMWLSKENHVVRASPDM